MYIRHTRQAKRARAQRQVTCCAHLLGITIFASARAAQLRDV